MSGWYKRTLTVYVEAAEPQAAQEWLAELDRDEIDMSNFDSEAAWTIVSEMEPVTTDEIESLGE